MPDHPESFDAVVVGGSYAGLSAAMQLARARQRVLVVDAGQRRNRFASASHGLIGQDGRAPDAIAADARAQVLAYPTVTWRQATAVRADGGIGLFAVEDDAGHRVQARRLVLATGVVDTLPPIDGLQPRWGRSVFHCPYCHGYELDRGRIGVIAVSEVSMHHALMLPDWGTVTFFLDGRFAPDDAQRAALAARGVRIEPARIAVVSGHADVELEDGRRVACDGLFVASRTQVASPLAEQLGCAFEDGPLGAFVRTDATQATSVPGVFACGDAARAAHSVALAIGDGAMAGAATHRSLLFD
ncbi:NAD(P)/FAD-dependent oxidoreductase [Luteimonas sp. FCS-9]|uniref:NAD(P)/FAD-dependent oxidoreductase n=1 Tax=Luteimonas sp. FCS-9 TaxID=1547516 RepID=UPI00063ED112|nr:NAD(P)/FAD-dependent oxidoreductase [Luteimonas sp. FCS-9]KLI99296.1 thioredoxin reductase [Luteimonas sp. FCS-9]